MKYGLIGRELSYSYSKEIHESLGLYEYELHSLPPEALPDFMAARNFLGLNVTIPYKRDVLTYCDALDPEAAVTGAANTLYFRDGLLRAANTDLFGMAFMAARAGIGLQDKNVLILGGGGTASTAEALAKSQGARRIWRAVRNPSGQREVSYGKLPEDAQVLINTTPVGCYPDNDGRLLSPGAFPDCSGVLDVIYNPLSTRLVQEAAEAGIPHSGGLPMLVAQALRAAELFTGNPGLTEKADEILNALQGRLQNIVLVGMPGSGKSTLGKALARKTGRPFVDLDAEIEKERGKSIPEIFEGEGEGPFREAEVRMAARVGRERGQVIATGGGTLLRSENQYALRQNGLLVFVDRPLGELARGGRPLSAGDLALQEMETRRRPLYEAASDLTIHNNGSVDEILLQLLDALDLRI